MKRSRSKLDYIMKFFNGKAFDEKHFKKEIIEYLLLMLENFPEYPAATSRYSTF